MKKILCVALILMFMTPSVYAVGDSNSNVGISEDQVAPLTGNESETIGEDNFICEVFGEDVQFGKQIPKIISSVIIVMQIMAPVLLVIFGSIDLVKGVASQKEDEIKKGQQVLIKRTIAAVLVFFVIAIVKFGISLFAKNSNGGLMSCVECFIKMPSGNRC